MKRFLVFILCLLTLGIDAAPGCIGPRVHNDLNGRPEYGLPGHVRCNCPCTSICEGGYCLRCGHVGELTRSRSFEQANRYQIEDYSGAFHDLVHRRI